MSNLFVCLMGMGTVFVGLICIIILCTVMGMIFRNFAKTPAKTPVAAPVGANTAVAQPIHNKQEVVAAVCTVIAEELGTDVNNIRVKSFKKV